MLQERVVVENIGERVESRESYRGSGGGWVVTTTIPLSPRS